MVRNWGGDGIENFLTVSESLVLRFGNNFLTTNRFGRYRAMSSTFEFVELDSIRISRDKQLLPKILLAVTASVLAITLTMAYLTDPISSNLIGLTAVGIFTIGQGYYTYRLFCIDVYRISGSGRIWKVRTMHSQQGLTFVEEMVKASNAAKSARMGTDHFP